MIVTRIDRSRSIIFLVWEEAPHVPETRLTTNGLGYHRPCGVSRPLAPDIGGSVKVSPLRFRRAFGEHPELGPGKRQRICRQVSSRVRAWPTSDTAMPAVWIASIRPTQSVSSTKMRRPPEVWGSKSTSCWPSGIVPFQVT